MRFQELIGTELQTRKNQYEKSANCQPLTLHTKIKVKFSSDENDPSHVQYRLVFSWIIRSSSYAFRRCR